jgi:hypothetical protein
MGKRGKDGLVKFLLYRMPDSVLLVNTFIFRLNATGSLMPTHLVVEIKPVLFGPFLQFRVERVCE